MEDIPFNENPLGRIGAPQQMTRNCDRHCDVINDVKREMHDADDVTLKCIAPGTYPMKRLEIALPTQPAWKITFSKDLLVWARQN